MTRHASHGNKGSNRALLLVWMMSFCEVWKVEESFELLCSAEDRRIARLYHVRADIDGYTVLESLR